MRIHEHRLQRHAQQRLEKVPAETAKRIRSFRSFLELESEHLRRRHEFGLGGREIARGRSDLVDVVVGRACRAVAEDLGPTAREELRGCAVVALGGYGRGELSPCSDVDLLFLHPGRPSALVTDFVEAVLPLLWDIGLEVGHSVRSVPDCVRFGRTDLHARNAMSEARLLLGSEALFDRLRSEMRVKVYGQPKANRFFKEAMAAEVEDRRGRFGSVVGMQEPHLKEGAGGLRDLHLVGWVGLARWGFGHPDELVRAGIVTVADHARALRAYDFILRIRNEAHFQTGRRTDLISLELQPDLASALGYADQRVASASEIFMRDFYLRARELLRFCDAFLVQADFWTPDEGVLSLRNRPAARAVGPHGRYRLRDGRLFAAGEGAARQDDPMRLFEVWEVAQKHGARVSEELLQEAHANLDVVDRRVRQSPEASAAFLRMLGRVGRVALALRPMHEAGLLAKYLPEFRRVTLMVQHDHYHRYTIDEHTLKAVEALDALADPASRPEALADLGDALEAVADVRRLALGILLHDIGKGQGGDHVTKGAHIAKRVCRRLGLDENTTSDVVFLVENHLVMSRISQRRDLTDQAVVRGFAETVGSLDRLRMLYVLTYADIRAVGPETWNDWKAALLRELFERTEPLLDGGRTRPGERDVDVAERVLEHLPGELRKSDVDAFLDRLPSRYGRLVPPALIARHVEMTRQLEDRPVLVDWRASERGPYTVVTTCFRDARGRLGRLAGALTGAGLDILSVDVFTRDDGLALDVFRVSEAMGPRQVQPVPEPRWHEITAQLEAVLAGKADPSEAVERQRTRQMRRRARRPPASPLVRFVPPDRSNRTVLEVRADDEPGVVYRIAKTLAGLDLDIKLAKIATEKNQALDIFYVTEEDGSPLGADRRSEVESALLEALGI
ncbi:MAG: [protein-PII] uridylyltransferase [Gemmatimonadota bacterium]|nr:[protein-PII] uridylyltransferase [Gemmatimonadota bacterium]